jgi:hypothetical protein
MSCVGATGFEPASPKSLIYSQMGQPIAQHPHVLFDVSILKHFFLPVKYDTPWLVSELN